MFFEGIMSWRGYYYRVSISSSAIVFTPKYMVWEYYVISGKMTYLGRLVEDVFPVVRRVLLEVLISSVCRYTSTFFLRLLRRVRLWLALRKKSISASVAVQNLMYLR